MIVTSIRFPFPPPSSYRTIYIIPVAVYDNIITCWPEGSGGETARIVLPTSLDKNNGHLFQDHATISTEDLRSLYSGDTSTTSS